MAYPINIKEKIISFRKKGYSLNEIHKKFGISKSTISGWVNNIVLNSRAKSRLLKKIKLGQFISAENKKRKTKELSQLYLKNSIYEVSRLNLNQNLAKIICSLIYYCEGTKDVRSGVCFMNSDSELIKTFLKLFRSSFNVDENKFRICLHLHKYHNPKKQINFWSKETRIPISQFIKSYLKQNTAKRSKKGYNGCASIRYHDALVAKLNSIAKAFFMKLGA
ncbi:helix-turn-helix domain-containing protein [Candidatus Wolfebacteria bacterium]|nr:helix-turn-helix domain-containing protein [Candidatus Wolfebacteria bacterium]